MIPNENADYNDKMIILLAINTFLPKVRNDEEYKNDTEMIGEVFIPEFMFLSTSSMNDMVTDGYFHFYNRLERNYYEISLTKKGIRECSKCGAMKYLWGR